MVLIHPRTAMCPCTYRWQLYQVTALATSHTTFVPCNSVSTQDQRCHQAPDNILKIPYLGSLAFWRSVTPESGGMHCPRIQYCPGLAGPSTERSGLFPHLISATPATIHLETQLQSTKPRLALSVRRAGRRSSLIMRACLGDWTAPGVLHSD